MNYPTPGPEPTSRVLQVNVRLSEGGAGQVMRTLHETLPEHGFQSTLSYGYGPSGRPSDLADATGATQLATRHRAAIHLVSHRLRGQESRLASREAVAQLTELAHAADVIHLHALHSYYIHPGDALEALMELGKPVVWTSHDHWLVTGRCAQPNGCQDWHRTNCTPCPNLGAYPPATVDRAGTHFDKRRALLDAASSRGRLHHVACAKWLAEDLQKAGFESVSYIHNSVDPEFYNVATRKPKSARPPRKRVLFICRDLRDPNKVDRQLLAAVAQLPNCELTIVGDHPYTPLPPGAAHVHAIGDRAALANLMRNHDVLLFTSGVDYHPLTIAEGLTAGLNILATSSLAANEFRDMPGIRIVPTSGDVLLALRTAETESALDFPQPNAHFSPHRMTEQYAALYRSLL